MLDVGDFFIDWILKLTELCSYFVVENVTSKNSFHRKKNNIKFYPQIVYDNKIFSTVVKFFSIHNHDKTFMCLKKILLVFLLLCEKGACFFFAW